MLEVTPESLLDSKEIKPVNRKGDQHRIFTRRTDAEAEAPAFWSYDANRQLVGKVSDAGKDGGQKEKRASEDEMAGRHHQCNERELGQTPGDGEGQGGLACCRPGGRRALDTTGRLKGRKNMTWSVLDLKQIRTSDPCFPVEVCALFFPTSLVRPSPTFPWVWPRNTLALRTTWLGGRRPQRHCLPPAAALLPLLARPPPALCSAWALSGPRRPHSRSSLLPFSCRVTSNSQQPRGLQPATLLCPSLLAWPHSG